MSKHVIPDGPRAAYTINETCAQLGDVSREWLYAQIRAGRIQSFKLGGRRFIARAELERIAQGEVA